MKRYLTLSPRWSDASPDTRTAKHIAMDILRMDGTRLHLVLAALVCLTLCCGGLYLLENVFVIVPWATLYYDAPTAFYAFDALYTAVDIGFVVLIACPLIYGTATVFFATADGQKLPLSAMFDGFSSAKRYLRAVLIVSAKVLPRALVLMLLVALVRAALGAETLAVALLWWLLSFAALVGGAIVLGLDDTLLPLALSNEAVGFFKLYRASLSRCAPRLIRILRFKLSFLLWGLASVTTLGVLLFSHALPYFCLTHAVWADVNDVE